VGYLPAVVTPWAQRGSFFQLRVGPLIGLACVVMGLARYRSYANRQFLGVWSYSFLLAFLIACALLLLSALNTWRATSRDPDVLPSPSARLWDLGILLWGVAYLLSAMDSPANAGRVLQMNFFGSVLPAAAALEWTAMAMFFVAGAFAVSKLGERWVKVGLAVGSVVFLALLVEGLARGKAAIAPAMQGAATHSYELWVRRHVKRNPEGFRDALHVLAARPGIRRLLCVGDSTAFGWGIPRTEDRFGEQLVQRLQVKTRHDWESLNASEPDTHTLDHIRFLERMLPYRPDVVVLLYVFNDIDYLNPDEERRRLLGDDSLSSRLNPLRVLYENFYAFQYLFVWGRRVYYTLHKDARPDAYLDPKVLAQHLVDLARFQSIATQTGAAFELVPLDVSVLEPKRRDRYRMFVQQAEASGLPVCSLDEAFDGFSFRDLTVNAIDTHPSERANHLAADVVAGCLSKRLEG
jgi:hypothetical protein